MNKRRQPFYNSRRKEEKTAPQKAEKRHYGLAMRDELFNEPLIADAPRSFMDSPSWKKIAVFREKVFIAFLGVKGCWCCAKTTEIHYLTVGHVLVLLKQNP